MPLTQSEVPEIESEWPSLGYFPLWSNQQGMEREVRAEDGATWFIGMSPLKLGGLSQTLHLSP
jgi:hypothetical protein